MARGVIAAAVVACISAVGAFLAFERFSGLPPDSPALLHPIERVAFSDDWRTGTTRTARPGEWVFVVLRTAPGHCPDIWVSDEKVRFSQMLPMDLQSPSGEGGRTGTFFEILPPRNAETCGQSRYVLAEWRVSKEETVRFETGGVELSVDIRLETRPRGGRPFFLGLGNSNLIRGHCPWAYCPREGELGRLYADFFTAHGLQPIQSWAAVPPIENGFLNLDAGGEKGRSFRQLVMGSAISGFIGFPRLRRYADPIAYLRALERTIQREGLNGRAWVYAVDEPSDLDALKAELELYDTYAPSAHIMVTTDKADELDPLIDVYAPVFNRLIGPSAPDVADYRGKALWSYLSCMGSCGPNRADRPNAEKVPGPDTGLPDLLIDRPASLLFQFFEAAERDGLGAALYYEATEGYRLIPLGIDPALDPWNFGGNGDGLLVFPGTPGRYGLTQDQPVASFRLKLLRYAMQAYW